MLRALIFDFDGVIADAEPVHMRAFQEVLGEEGLSLSRQEYYDKYLALDDKTFFRTALKDKGRDFDQKVIENLMARKSNYYDRLIKEEIVILPGVTDFVRNAAQRYRLAIGSGALRHEIEFILDHAGIKGMFRVITSAEDVENCKPAPDVFIKALERINDNSRPEPGIKPDECLVIEDSIAGIKAARAAGMKCLAVTNSYSAERLSQADMVVRSLEDVKMEDLEKLF
jgi:HAD superfamily hydrolase (TIGR01509 family)